MNQINQMNQSDDSGLLLYGRPAYYYTGRPIIKRPAGLLLYGRTGLLLYGRTGTAGRRVMRKSGGHFGIDLGMKKSKRDLLDLYFATQCGYGVQWKMKCVS